MIDDKAVSVNGFFYGGAKADPPISTDYTD